MSKKHIYDTINFSSKITHDGYVIKDSESLTEVTLPSGERHIVSIKLIKCPLCDNNIKIFIPNENLSIYNQCYSCKIKVDIDAKGNILCISMTVKEFTIECNFINIEIYNNHWSIYELKGRKIIKYKNNQQLQQLINTHKLFI